MIVTEKKIVKIDRSCVVSPLFVTWKNTANGQEHWLFKKVQSHGITTSSGESYLPAYDELSALRSSVLEDAKEAVPYIIAQAQVLQEDIRGIKTLLYSPSVEILLNPESWEAEGPKWYGARPKAGSFRLYETDEIRPTIEIAFDLNPINNIER